MTDIKLSICIPTYNRAPYLRTALACLADANFSFPFEIVVSDNASTDDTGDVVQSFIAKGLPIRYLRCPENAGPAPNLLNAILQASGEYLVYQGDDDMLVADGVEEAIRYLDANPDVTSVQAPWYLYDEVEDVDRAQFYALDRDTRFEAQDFVGAFEFLFEGHIFPEIGIYRAPIMKSAWVPRNICFWPFAYLAHFLDQGAVTFLQKPFYRSVSVSKIAPQREQIGFQDVMTSWDMYRGGLEYFLHFAEKRGKLVVNEKTRPIYERMCTVFVVIRMSVAVRMWVARNDWIRAYELYTRMASAGYGDYGSLPDLVDHFPAMVGLQTLATMVNAVTDIHYLVITGVDDPDHIGELLRDLGLLERVTIVTDLAVHDAALTSRTAALVLNPEQEKDFLDRGFNPNFLFRDSELVRYVLV